MPYGLYLSAEGASIQARRLEVLANNLANVDTTGFKRDLALFQARYTEAVEQGIEQPGGGTLDDLSGGVALAGTSTDFSPGPLKRTGGASDVAIEGDAFFVVERGGESLLTRAGNFTFNSQGQLVTTSGYPVLNDAGSPIVVDPAAGPWEVTPDGGVLQAGAINYLAMVRPQSLGDLVKTGENLYRPLGPTAAIEPPERRVASGFLEASGVRPTLEMMELIETTRAYEANTTMIRNQDQAMGSLISRVLREA
jgi:flagellar basal-body rod protein FlgF